MELSFFVNKCFRCNIWSQKLCANVTIIKLELVWEGKYVRFFSEQCSNALKDFFSHIHLKRYVIYQIICICTYILSGHPKRINVRPSVRHGFMNFIQIGRYKTNADARSQFYHFVGNITKKARLNHRLQIDLILPKSENLNKKTYHCFSLFQIK